MTLKGLVAVFLCLLTTVAGQASKGSGSGDIVLITNWGDDTLSLVDIAAGKELSVIKVGAKPYDIKVDAAGRFAYVTNSGSGDVSVVDIQTNLESQRIAVGVGPRDIDITSDGKTLITANSGEDTISVVDIDTKKEAFKVKVGSIPYGIALAKNDSIVLITNWGDSSISVVDLASKAEKKRLKVGSLPYTAASIGNVAYVSNFGAHTVTPINLNSLSVGRPIAVGHSPWGLAVSGDQRTAVVANFYSGDLSVFRLPAGITSANTMNAALNLKESARIALKDPLLPDSAGGLGGNCTTCGRAKNAAVTTDGSIAVISNLAGNSLFVVDTMTQRVLRTIPVGKAPYGIAFIK